VAIAQGLSAFRLTGHAHLEVRKADGLRGVLELFRPGTEVKATAVERDHRGTQQPAAMFECYGIDLRFQVQSQRFPEADLRRAGPEVDADVDVGGLLPAAQAGRLRRLCFAPRWWSRRHRFPLFEVLLGVVVCASTQNVAPRACSVP
jgi:hypothetical protein